MNKFIFQLFSITIILTYLLISCEDDKPITDDPINSIIELNSFGFLNENNQLLTQNYIGVITDNQIEITIPSVTQKLIATFETNASKVIVNGLEQTSNVTLNDFSKPIIYTLVSEDGTKEFYTIKINWISPIPHIKINTDQNADIVLKDVYLNADIEITANGWGADFEGSASGGGGIDRTPELGRSDGKSAETGGDGERKHPETVTFRGVGRQSN